ncbi:hypothetical protein RND81_09G041000 [Saponaria officinalis]|uniref:Reverse transcriptase zinc-binding domain-containing protein n=1 Tax=Saponaria officinalis TaxID=3572 RepID=A0AAW1IIE8_SAPOF
MLWFKFIKIGYGSGINQVGSGMDRVRIKSGYLSNRIGFGWQAYHAKLATIDNLKKRGFQLVNRCYLCHCENESHSHLFFQCSFMRLLWRAMMLWVGITRRPRNLRHELEWIYSHCKGKALLSRLERTVFVAIIYHGWIERNYRVFRNLVRDVPTICKQIQFEIMCRYYGRVM